MSRIFSLILIFCVGFFSLSFADNNIYLIENLPVNVSAQNPSAASAVAVKKVNREAFMILISRLNIDEKIATKISDEEISDMIRSQYINEEKIAGNNYSGIFNITFAKDFVDHILTKKLQPEVYLSSDNNALEKPFILLPIKVSSTGKNIWHANNIWRSAIAKAIAKNSQKFVLLENSAEHIAAINNDNIDELNYDDITPLINEYNASAIYFMFFNFDANSNRANVDLVSLGLVGKKKTRLNFSNINAINNDALEQIIAEKVLQHLSGLRPDKKSFAGIINLEARVKNLDDYLTIKNKIENSGLVNQASVSAISRHYVLLKLNYVGNFDVASSFASKGIAVQHRGENNYLINSN